MSYTIYPKKIIKLITLVAISRELLLNIRALSIIRISSPSRPNNNIVPILVTSLFVTYPYIASRINTIEVAKKVIAIEDILNDNNEVCGQRITLYNLQYHNNFSKNAGSMSWGYPLNAENQYIEVIVELEDDTLQISSAK